MHECKWHGMGLVQGHLHVNKRHLANKNWYKTMKNMSYRVVSTVPADDLAPLGVRASAGSVIAMYRSCKCRGLALVRLYGPRMVVSHKWMKIWSSNNLIWVSQYCCFYDEILSWQPQMHGQPLYDIALMPKDAWQCMAKATHLKCIFVKRNICCLLSWTN